MTKQIYKNKYLHLDFYWKGIALGIVVDSEILTIIIPFFALEVNLFMFKKNKSNK